MAKASRRRRPDGEAAVEAGAVPAETVAADFPPIDLAVRPPFPPMEALATEELPSGDGWLYDPESRLAIAMSPECSRTSARTLPVPFSVVQGSGVTAAPAAPQAATTRESAIRRPRWPLRIVRSPRECLRHDIIVV